MTMKKILSIAAASLALLAALSSCQKEQGGVAKATLIDFQTLEVSATDVDDATLSVISDGEWTITEYPDWVTVSPLSGGAGETLVTISISDNLDGDEVDFPREGKIVLGGTRLSSKATLTISQAGDRYKGAPAYTLETITDAKDSSTVSIDNATAILETSKYLLITDGDGFALTDAPLSLEEKATVKGVKTVVYGITLISSADVLDPAAGDSYTFTAEDITATLDAFDAADNGKYVTVEGVAKVPGTETVNVIVSSQEDTVSVVYPESNLNFAKLTNHKVLLTGFAFRDGDAKVSFIASTVEDKGMTRTQDVIAQWKLKGNGAINAPTFTGEDTTADDEGAYIPAATDPTAGDGGKYVAATTGTGSLTYTNIDKTKIDTKNGTGYSKRCLDANGYPYIMAGQKGEYWKFTADLGKEYAAGSTVNFTMSVYATAGGLKYWTLEIYDNGQWIPMMETQTATVTTDGTITYNFAQVTKETHSIEVNYNLAAAISGTIQIRYRVMSNMGCGGKYKSTPDGGVHKICGTPAIKIAYDE